MHKIYGSSEINSSNPATVTSHQATANVTDSIKGSRIRENTSEKYVSGSTPTKPIHDKPIKNYLIRAVIILGIVVCTPVITVATTTISTGMLTYFAGCMAFEALNERNTPLILTSIATACAAITGVAAGVLLGILAGPILTGVMIYGTALGADVLEMFT